MAKLSVLFILIFVMTSVKIPRATGVSCSFETSWCGWSNEENTSLHWSQDTDCAFLFWGCNTYLKLEMNQAEVNDTGILSSPWLNGSAHLSCQLQFRYDVGNDDACQLSVLLRTETTLTSLWASDDTSGTPDIEIPRAERQYQIVFEGKKATGGLWSRCNEIRIDDVNFIQQSITPSPTSASPITTTKAQQSTQHQTSDVPSSSRQTETYNFKTTQPAPVGSDNPATVAGTVLASTTSGGKGRHAV